MISSTLNDRCRDQLQREDKGLAIGRRSFINGALCLGAAMAGGAVATVSATQRERPDYRPRLHYTPPTGFMNDPNGLVFFAGEYHLYYQYNPAAATMGNVHWGHAVSTDLLNWRTLPTTLAPTPAGLVFSGSAVVDHHDTSGFFAGGEGGIVAIYTRAAADLQTQEIAFSGDAGRTLTPYGHNPVIDRQSSQFRDPKVFWHAPDERWILVVVEARSHQVLFYGSADLKAWTLLGEFGHAGLLGVDYECPDLVRLPVEGGGERWVLIVSINPGAPLGGSAVQYFVGEFDGKTFVAEDAVTRLMDFGKDFYAFQTFANVGETIGIAWMSNWQYANDVPAWPSRGAMTLPRRLGLRRVRDDWRLVQRFPDLTPQVARTLVDGARPSGSGVLLEQALTPGAALEIQLQVELPSAELFTLSFVNEADEQLDVGMDAGPFGGLYIDHHRTQGFEHRYVVTRLSHASLPGTRTMDLHLILDRSSLELLGEQGAVAGTALYFASAPFSLLRLVASGGQALVPRLLIRQLRDIPSATGG